METMTTYNNNPVLRFNYAQHLIYCDEKMPPVNIRVAIIVVQVDQDQPTSVPLEIEVDEGWLNEDGSWVTCNDWDEGQPWAVVAWMPMPDEAAVRSHEIKWINAPSK